MTLGSLFSGIGGFDLGFEQAGFAVAWQCDNDRFAQQVLRMHWPDVPCYDDVRRIADGTHQPAAVDVLAGGDPCPVRSRARGNRRCNHPDLAGYYLAVAGRLRPRWVVRENVVAPDVLQFAAGLECLGYAALVIELDSAGFTGQSRTRQFCVGCPGPGATAALQFLVSQRAGSVPSVAPCGEEEAPVTACLTAHHKRYCAEDSYVYEDGRGLRILTPTERERLHGFPGGWTAGLSDSRRCILTGNAVTVPVARYLAELILQAEAQP